MKRLLSSKVYLVFLHLFASVGVLFSLVFFGMQLGVFSVKGSIAERNSFFQESATSSLPLPKKDDYRCTDGTKTCDIFLTPEWQTVSYGLKKDTDVLHKVSKETGVSVRLLVSLAVPEQLRFFSAEREVYKRYFEPLKILGTMSQFSLGVTGIKPHTAEMIENNLVASSTPYYLGPEYEKILSYKDGEEKDKVLYERLTNSKDHYYSYLYTALFIKQIQTAWEKTGFPIAEKDAGVYATLFNLGFEKSLPKNNPHVGGATITLGGKVYTYGEIATRFLESDELVTQFPKK